MSETREKDLAKLMTMEAAPVGIQVTRAGQKAKVPEYWRPVEGAPAYETEVEMDTEKHQTLADRINYLCHVTGGRYFREIGENGQPRLVLALEDGTRIGGQGETTAHAFNALLARAQVLLAEGAA